MHALWHAQKCMRALRERKRKEQKEKEDKNRKEKTRRQREMSFILIFFFGRARLLGEIQNSRYNVVKGCKKKRNIFTHRFFQRYAFGKL